MRLTRVRHASDPIAQVLGPEGLLRTRLESYESRPAQLAMARAVATTLAGGGRLVVEAGTGTGKTLAYLVPALLSELKTVISTGTRTLQEQIRAKDVPLALELLGQDGLQVLCMKGLSNYLCLRRLAEARRAPRLFPERELELVVRWAERTETGDRAELAELPEGAPVWADVCSSPEGRIGPRCTHFEDCFVTRMRRAAASARLLIVNHHLLLADLALRASYPAASVIPPCEALIIDEAHQLEAVATAFFGQSFSSATLATLARDVERATRSARGDAEPAALSRAHRAVEAGAELFHLLAEEFRLPAAPSGARGPELPALVREGEGD
jgi:ATP-dependent DNA helicase DinG